ARAARTVGPASRARHLRRGPRASESVPSALAGQPAAVSRYEDVPRGRHSDQGRPRQYGVLARSARAAAQSRLRRVRDRRSARSEAAPADDQVSLSTELAGHPAPGDPGPPEKGLQHAGREMAGRSAPRPRPRPALGKTPTRGGSLPPGLRGWAAPRARRAPDRPPQGALDAADV